MEPVGDFHPDAILIIITIIKPKKPNMRPKYPDELYGYLGLIRYITLGIVINLNLVRSFGWFWAESSSRQQAESAALPPPVK